MYVFKYISFEDVQKQHRTIIKISTIFRRIYEIAKFMTKVVKSFELVVKIW